MISLLYLGDLHSAGRVILELQVSHVVHSEGRLELSSQAFLQQDLLLLLLLIAQV